MPRVVVELIADDAQARAQMEKLVSQFDGGVRRVDAGVKGWSKGLDRFGSQLKTLVLQGGGLYMVLQMVRRIADGFEKVRRARESAIEPNLALARARNQAVEMKPPDMTYEQFDAMAQEISADTNLPLSRTYDIMKVASSTKRTLSPEQLKSAVAMSARLAVAQGGELDPDLVTALQTSMLLGKLDPKAAYGYTSLGLQQSFVTSREAFTKYSIPAAAAMVKAWGIDFETALEESAIWPTILQESEGPQSRTAQLNYTAAIMKKHGNTFGIPAELTDYKAREAYARARVRKMPDAERAALEDQIKESGDAEMDAVIAKLEKDGAMDEAAAFREMWKIRGRGITKPFIMSRMLGQQDDEIKRIREAVPSPDAALSAGNELLREQQAYGPAQVARLRALGERTLENMALDNTTGAKAGQVTKDIIEMLKRSELWSETATGMVGKILQERIGSGQTPLEAGANMALSIGSAMKTGKGDIISTLQLPAVNPDIVAKQSSSFLDYAAQLSGGAEAIGETWSGQSPADLRRAAETVRSLKTETLTRGDLAAQTLGVNRENRSDLATAAIDRFRDALDRLTGRVEAAVIVPQAAQAVETETGAIRGNLEAELAEVQAEIERTREANRKLRELYRERDKSPAVVEGNL